MPVVPGRARRMIALRRAPAAAVAVALALSCGGERAELPAAGTNLVLVTLDTFRADHLGCYGHPGVRAPHIDRLAREGAQFAECYASVPLTLPSHATLLTGLSPRRHGVHENGAYVLEEKWTTLAERLRGAGYRTAAVVSSFQLASKYGLDQGFESYDDSFPAEMTVYDERIRRGPKGDHFRFDAAERRAEDVTAGLGGALPAGGGAPFFLWLHYFDAHVIYDPPPPYDRMYGRMQGREGCPENLYCGEISYLDRHIGKLVELLEEKRLYRSTLIVVVGDHGEGLGEHSETYHDQFIYDSTLRVPLIIGGGAVRDGWLPLVPVPAAAENLLPTLLDLLGVRWGEDDVDGVTLAGRMRGEAGAAEPPQYLETYAPLQNLCSKLFGLRRGGWKYIEAPAPELYDLDADPGERVNLVKRDAGRAAEMRALLFEKMGGAEAPPAEIDSRTRERLEAIGYLQRSRGKGGADAPAGDDPKAMAEYVNGLHVSMMHYTRGEYDSALALSLELSEKYPGQTQAGENIVTLLVLQDRYEEMIRILEPMVERNPGWAKGYYHLGEACMRLVRDDEAIGWLRKAVAADTRFPEAEYNLAAVLARNGWLDEALRRFEKAAAVGNGDLATAARQAAARVRAVIGQSGGAR